MLSNTIAQRKQRAIALLQSGLVAEAKTHFSALSIDARRDPDVWHLLAACHCMLGDDRQGEDCARKAVVLSPSFAGAWANLGSALLGQHKLIEAEGALREAIKRAPTDAQAHSNLGNVYREMKRVDDAERCYRKAIHLQPNFPDALTNLGLAMQDRHQLNEATALHRRALSLNAHHVDAHYNLGYALMLLGEEKEAIPFLKRVTQLRPQESRGWISLGAAHARVHNHGQAVLCYEHCVGLDPNNAENLSALGVCYLSVGEREKSIAALMRAIELNPDDSEAYYWLAAAGVGVAPETMSADAVAKLFDGYAGNFDEHLVGKLQYHTPALLSAALRRALGDAACELSVLDLGCGTGLLGAELRDIAVFLAGVDLSPNMIERARARRIYDDLAVQDITDYLETTSGYHDAVVAADVFVYVGNLDRVFAATSARLSTGGLFAFSVESHLGDEPYRLRPSGRYAQSLSYLRDLSTNYGFAEISVDPVVLRMENRVPMEGNIVVLRRQS